ncbi:hypothetical protein CEXT_317641 [Caerostris extrusa]|uniref:Uncharacterized protein n=1 Tax=Caerostris extrusa TaxID=172846 RepID=A0AAV4MXX5_CAEEX|nr:hypothetical protein CEXT_317641 [Caerostris extrusa]
MGKDRFLKKLPKDYIIDASKMDYEKETSHASIFPEIFGKHFYLPRTDSFCLRDIARNCRDLLSVSQYGNHLEGKGKENMAWIYNT